MSLAALRLSLFTFIFSACDECTNTHAHTHTHTYAYMHTSTITHLRLASLLLMLLVAVIVRDLFPVLFGLGLALAVSLGDLSLA